MWDCQLWTTSPGQGIVCKGIQAPCRKGMARICDLLSAYSQPYIRDIVHGPCAWKGLKSMISSTCRVSRILPTINPICGAKIAFPLALEIAFHVPLITDLFCKANAETKRPGCDKRCNQHPSRWCKWRGCIWSQLSTRSPGCMIRIGSGQVTHSFWELKKWPSLHESRQVNAYST